MDKNTNQLSTEASINKVSFQDSNGLNNIFSIGAASSSTTLVQFSLSQRQAAFINEIGVFTVSDDKGTVNGIAPGQAGYMQAALNTSRVIFSSLSDKVSSGIEFVRQLSFKASERFGFYLVANDTTSSIDTQITSSKAPDNVFFSLSSSNIDNFDHVRVTNVGKSSFNLAWEDLKGGGDKDFNDLVLKMEIGKTTTALGASLQGQKEGEIIDLRGATGFLSAQFTVNNNSANRPLIGFYRVNDALGTVTDPLTGKAIAPGEVGYEKAAIRQSIVNFNQSSTSPTSIDGGLFATYIITNGTVEQFLSSNQNNTDALSPVAYFTYKKANPDKTQHIRLLGDNTFGFEAPSSRGKYEYTVFKVDLSVKTGTNIDNNNNQNTNSQFGGLAFTSANYSDFEGDNSTVNKVVARIGRTGGSDGAVSVQVQLDNGSTATPTDDYTSNLPITVNFVAGETSKDVVIPIVGDSLFEPDETIKLSLFNPTGGASLGTQLSTTYTIKNDDAAPIFNFSAATYSVDEGNTNGFTTNAQVTLKRTNNTTGTDTVVLQLANGTTDGATGGVTADTLIDYNNSPITVSFNSGEDTKTVLIPVAGDTTFEQNENVALTLTNPSSGSIGTTNPNAVLVINNDDAAPPPPTVSITASNTIATETGTTSTYTISRVGDASMALTVNLGIDSSSTAKDTDYSLSGGSMDATGTIRSVVIGAGQSSVNVTFTAINDGNAAEESETLKLNLASGNYNIDTTNNNATITIAANGTEVINTLDDATGTDYTKMEGSLRQALLNANTSPGLNNITFNIPTSDSGYNTSTEMYTITLTDSLPEISDDVNIKGLGANKLTVSGNNSVRVFNIISGKTVNIDGLTIANGNSQNSGGGIFNAGTLTVTNSTLSKNSTSFYGGGIFNSGTLTVTSSTLNSNFGKYRGGGIFNNGGTLRVTNSTLSKNSTENGDGGGIFTFGTLTLTNSTVFGNFGNYSGGGISNQGTVNVKNTIIAGNTASAWGPDYDGSLTSQGYNLIGIYSGTANNGDIFGTSGNPVDPKLGLLQDNGGLTYTMALLPGSPAIDRGDPNFTSPPGTDQRGTGFNRIKNGRIDIGAFESEYFFPT